MTFYVTKRLVESLIVLLVMSFAIYALMALMPGDPIDIMVQSDPHLTPADATRLKEIYGLDQPLGKRYANWFFAAVQGDFGYSRIHNRPTLEILAPRLVNTAWLMLASLLFSLIIALPIGIYSALHPYSKTDYLVNFLALGGISIPVFWLALMLIVVFSVWLGWLPASGIHTVGESGLADSLRHMILPVVTLSIASIGSLTRYVRAAMMEVLRNDYIRTARAKGLSQSTIVFKHALRNAMIPVVTVIALSFGTLFSGALITETMFSYLGMGKLIYDSIIGNDFNMALVSLLFATALVLASNLLADLIYAWLDPRIHYR
ncbi:MAG: Glutathione transport system permease protein GsiC [Alphaproteobacteria bacterium MarineAlpha9_Bin7]|nr:MAG: Glutathione transport system permease protein GsiC [Alphaproteobacteria bacterium MarineAlpha9_Bin7]